MFDENFVLQNDDSGYCPYTGDFNFKEALYADDKGKCHLGPISLYPVATDTVDEGCPWNHPKLGAKIISGANKDELKIYFSQDGGKTYYNEDEPRLAIPIRGYDADGKDNDGSSKGGKVGKNNRRLVEEAKSQLQRRLSVLCGSEGDDCDDDPTAFFRSMQCFIGYYCFLGKCYSGKEGDPCGCHWCCEDYLLGLKRSPGNCVYTDPFINVCHIGPKAQSSLMLMLFALLSVVVA